MNGETMTVHRFRELMRAAVGVLEQLEPAHVHPSLRAPLSLWFRATEEEARRGNWESLLGRNTVPVVAAARAVVDLAEEGEDDDRGEV